MKRRDFFMTSAAIGAGLAVAPSISGTVSAAEPATKGDQREKAKLRFSSQLGIIPGANDAEKMKLMKKWGFEAAELGGLGGNFMDYKKMADDAGLEVSAICWGSCNGDLVSDDVDKRQPGIDRLKEQLERAGQIGSTGVIYVPAFNGQTKLTNQEIRKLLCEFLHDVSKFADECGTKVIFEPLNRGEAFFLRQVADAASIARDCNKARNDEEKDATGIAVMGDFYHMYKEEPDDMGAFISGGTYMQHVHLANGIDRRLPGTKPEHSFVNGFRGLKYIGYDKFVSFECGVEGEREIVIPKCLDYLRECWEQA